METEIIFMISTDDFLLNYWKHYIQLEKEFSSTINYVAISTINFETYSDAYLKLLLQIGSEVDVSCKLLCEILGTSMPKGTIGSYKRCIMNKIVGFADIRINEQLSKISNCPWEEWKYNASPTWWVIYNKIKHHRITVGTINGVKQEYYKFANLKYTMMALMGLYQLMLYSYYFIANYEGSDILAPLPGSRLFDTKSSIWSKIDKGPISIHHYDKNTGILTIATGPFDY